MPGIGEGIDAYNCINGDKLSCFALFVAGSGAAYRAGADAIGSFSKADDAIGAVPPSSATGDLVNLADDSRSAHILDGHRAGAGLGKSEFPAGWSDALTLNHVSDIATDPSLTWVQQTGKAGDEFTRNGVPVKYMVDGVRDGVTIRVIIQPGGEGIITAFPIG